jgi:hypothetical protein
MRCFKTDTSIRRQPTSFKWELTSGLAAGGGGGGEERASWDMPGVAAMWRQPSWLDLDVVAPQVMLS